MMWFATARHGRASKVPARPTMPLLAVVAATLLAVQIVTAQGPIRDFGAVGPMQTITHILNVGVTPAPDDALTGGGPSEGDDAPRPGAALPVPPPRVVSAWRRGRLDHQRSFRQHDHERSQCRGN